VERKCTLPIEEDTMRDRDFEEEITEEFRSPYCPICTSCGESGCCPPLMCRGTGGSYCLTYFKELQYEFAINGGWDEDKAFDAFLKPK
jgi:hypothetical protein